MATSKKASMTYAEQLKHPKWQKKRLEIMKRDKFMCMMCKDEDLQLHVHHLSYEHGKKAWQYKNSNFVTLCEKCHSIEHHGMSTLETFLYFKIISILKFYKYEDSTIKDVRDFTYYELKCRK